MTKLEAEALKHFSQYDGYRDIEECLIESDPNLLADLCRERGRRLAVDAEIADCVRWMMQQRICFDVAGGVMPSLNPAFNTPEEFVEAVNEYRKTLPTTGN